jgi:hypothetical protein
MPTTAFTTTKTTTHEVKSYIPEYVFIVQLHDGRFVIGQGNNPAKRIASINSGYNKLISGCLQVNRIIGVKPINEDRSFVGTVNKFIESYGEDFVIAI